MARRFLIVLLGLLARSVAGQDVADIPTEEKARLQTEARSLRDQASAIRSEAEARHADAQKACWGKFLVSACHADAATQLRTETDRARKLDHQAREIERDIRKREFAAREARRLQEEPAREAAAAARAEKNRAQREEALQRVERKQAEAAGR